VTATILIQNMLFLWNDLVPFQTIKNEDGAGAI